MEQEKQKEVFLDWLRACLVNGHTGDYPEHELIELIAALNEDLPLLCPDQYLS